MRGLVVLIAACTATAAADLPALLERLSDPALTSAQRNDACFALRGGLQPAVRARMAELLADEALRACAARNLQELRAVDELAQAAADPKPDVRAVAVDALGRLQDPEQIPRFMAAARDPNALVSMAGLQALALLDQPPALDALLQLAAANHPAGLMALEAALRFRSPRVLTRARELLAVTEIPARLTALRIIGEQGDASDLAALKALTPRDEEMTAGPRGFGLMPPISIARLARMAITRIEARSSSSASANGR
ncbi:MAG: HEAT repeat domain-containing protein [Acidobacteria bacterium]|nr:HEAT repeat domain-containing protein [Acidobacteriota bacterium]